MMKRQFTLLLVVFLVSNFALSTLIVSLSNRAQNQRKANTQLLDEQRATARKTAIAVKSFECILLIEPQYRTDENLTDCKMKAINEIDKE